MKKIRADLLLVSDGLVPSRHQAQALILAGRVFGKKRIEKPGELVDPGTPLVVEKGDDFVSRGGVKLAGVLDQLKVDPRGKVCLDAGASTGGFTDCLLQRGAKKVYAVDVGYGQFHAKLRNDPRVVLMEKTNLRSLPRLPELIDLITLDLSFISLTKVLSPLKLLLHPEGQILALVKPQFELSPKEVKKGVVRDEELRQKAMEKVKDYANTIGLKVAGGSESVLPGPKGNREIFLLLTY